MEWRSGYENNMAWNRFDCMVFATFLFFFFFPRYWLHIVRLTRRNLSYIVLVCIPMSSVHLREHAIVGRFLLKQVEIDK